MSRPKELPVKSRVALLAGTLFLCLSVATPGQAATAPAEENVTFAYAPVLRVSPVYGVARVGGERRIVAYDVEYQYKGETFMSRLGHDPGSRLRIRIAITPDETADGTR